MISNLIVACGLASGVALPSISINRSLIRDINDTHEVISSPSRSITTEINGDFDITYKYTSNEVNSFSDLIEGNIYNFQVSATDWATIPNSSSNNIFRVQELFIDFHGRITNVYNDLFIRKASNTQIRVYADNIGQVAQINLAGDYPMKGMLVYKDDSTINEQYFSIFNLSYCDYNEIVSVTPITSHSNLYTLIYDFYYYIFENGTLSGITTAYNMPFDSWLCHSLTIITLLTGIFIIFLFLKWIFKVVSGLILLKS